MPTLAEEEASEESDYEEESEDVFNELVDRLRKVALEAQVCQVHNPNLTSCIGLFTSYLCKLHYVFLPQL